MTRINDLAPAARRGPLAVVTHTVPGEANGQAVMLDRLTGSGGEPRFILIDTARKRRPAAARAPAAPRNAVPTPFLYRKLSGIRGLQSRAFELLVRQRAAAIARLLRRHRCAAVVGCTGGDLVDLPAVVRAGRITGLPAFLYYFDDYRLQWTMRGGRWCAATAAVWAAPIERDSLAGAAGVIVPNEVLAADVRRRTATPVAVVRNPVDNELYDQLRRAHGPATIRPDGPIRIVYTGSVYAAQVDSLVRCCAAVRLLRDRGFDPQIHVYGDPPAREIAARFTTDGIVFHAPVSGAAAARLQVEADILFLPLSFDCEYPELIRSSAPGKFGEYLASGTPVVIHAPPDSFPIGFAARHAAAVCCPEPEATALADGFARLLSDGEYASRIAAAAVKAAQAFSLPLNRRLFADFLGGGPSESAAGDPSAAA